MNISFFLKPKVEVSYLLSDTCVKDAVHQLLETGFSAIPMIDPHGQYVGTVCEGDFLRLLLTQPTEQTLSAMPVGAIERRFAHRTVAIDAKMDDLVDLVTDQNFVPVADGRGMFIGIVTRHDLLTYLREKKS